METLTVSAIKETGILNNPTPRTWQSRECIQQGHGVAAVDGKITRPVCVRWYMGRSRNTSIVYCTVSISTDTLSTHGHGHAGGYGYDKKSAALACALRSAAVALSRSIHGTGESRQAIKAIVKYLYPDATDVTTIVG